jgi:hypothetical protein
MKNIQENIYKVKSLMGLINEQTENSQETTTPIYLTINNFSSLADDIYQDLIKGLITNVKIESNSIQKLSSDNKTLDSIDFILDIDGLEFFANFSQNGLSLIDKRTNQQVKPIWTDNILKYRPFNTNEKKTGNEWMKTQVELKLEHFKNRFKQLI